MSKYKELKKLVSWAKDHWRDAYDEARSDLEFQTGEPGAQWNSEEYNDRIDSGRPAVTMDQLDQFINQVGNAVKATTPSVIVYPGDKKTSKESADIFKGIVRAVEYNSAADECYDSAVMSAIRCSIGWIRVDHDYKDKYKFSDEQELTIKKIANPLTVYLDPRSVRVDGSDAEFGFIEDTLTLADFKERFPEAEPISFAEDKDPDGQTLDLDYDDDSEEKKIVVIEMFRIEPNEKDKRVYVKKYFLSGAGIINEEDDKEDKNNFPGKLVPLIPVFGAEFWVNKKRILLSLIRKAKDPQKLYNLWKSLETEMLQKQTIAPYMAAEGQIEDYVDDYMNPHKVAALRYKQVDIKGKLAPPPQRTATPQMSPGLVNAAMGMKDDVKGTMGLYNAALGQQSNETSGKAIQERKAQGDMATYHFGDNLFKSIAQVGRVLIHAIPDIYTGRAALMIVGRDDEPKIVGVNGELTEGQKVSYMLNEGQYGVRVTTGTPFLSQQQEATETMLGLIQSRPDLMNVFGDLLFKNWDFPGAQDIAERFKKMLPPNLQSEEDMKGANPEIVQAQQHLEQMAQQLEQSKMQLEQMNQQLEEEKANNDQKTQLEQQKLALEAKKMQTEYNQQLIAAETKREELELKRFELELKSAEAVQAQRIDALESTLKQLEPFLTQLSGGGTQENDNV